MSCLLLAGCLVVVVGGWGGGLLQSNLALTQRDNTWGRCSGLGSLSKRHLRVLRVLLRRDGLYLFSLHMQLDLAEERGRGGREGGMWVKMRLPCRTLFSVSDSSTLSLSAHTAWIWPPTDKMARRLAFFFSLNHLITKPVTLFSFQSFRSDVSSQYIHSIDCWESGTGGEFYKLSSVYWWNIPTTIQRKSQLYFICFIYMNNYFWFFYTFRTFSCDFVQAEWVNIYLKSNQNLYWKNNLQLSPQLDNLMIQKL